MDHMDPAIIPFYVTPIKMIRRDPQRCIAIFCPPWKRPVY